MMPIDMNIPEGATHRCGNMFFRRSTAYGHIWESASKSSGYTWKLFHGHAPAMTVIENCKTPTPRKGIPAAGIEFIELHMQQARESDRDDFAEQNLKQVEAILGYALQCEHIDAVEYGNRITLLNLIRAQRQHRRA